MGARTDFVKAMAYGVIVGVATTTAFFQLRKSDCPAAPAVTAPAPAPAPSSSVREAPAPVPVVDAAPVAAPRPPQIVDRLTALGVPSNLAEVTCKLQCCTVSIDDGAYEEHADDIKRALDIAPGTAWQSRKAGTIRVIEKCW